MHEGQDVDLPDGEVGHVLSLDDDYAHVMRTTGARRGEVELVDLDDLLRQADLHEDHPVQASLDDSLDYGPERVENLRELIYEALLTEWARRAEEHTTASVHDHCAALTDAVLTVLESA